MSILDQLKPLLEKPFFTTKEAREIGVHPSHLSYYTHKGDLEKVSRGVYKGPNSKSGLSDLQFEDLFVRASSIQGSVICMLSALGYYNLTDEFMWKIWLAVPHGRRVRPPADTHIVQMRDLKTGVNRIEVGRFKVLIVDRERAIIDAFRYLDKEVAIKSLKYYLQDTQDHKVDIKKLVSHSKILRMNIDTYIEALTI